MSDGLKTWPCQRCTEPVGVIVRDGTNVDRLNVLRRPAHRFGGVVAVDPDDKKSFSVIGLESGMVVCPMCGHQQRWYLSERALERFLEKRAERSKKQSFDLTGGNDE